MNSKPETLQDHQERMNRVYLHIQQHLDQPIQLEELARIACFSVFHFHRLFAAFTGEPLSSYIRRLRLEQAAVRLCYTPHSITDIALAAGYETPGAFTRAFSQLFEESPSSFRKKKVIRLVTEQKRVVHNQHKERAVKPEIKTRKETPVIFVRRTGKYQESARQAWEAVCNHAFPRGLVGPQSEFIGVSHDDPAITAEEKLRYDACISVAGEAKAEGEVGVQTLTGGNFAVFLHKGPYDKLKSIFGAIYAEWLPSSGKKLRDAPCFEKYLNDCSKTKPEDLLTEIYIPIE